jgi:hypothetical protein
MPHHQGRLRRFTITTRTRLGAPPTTVWPLLFDSRMDRAPRCPVFVLGAPRPVECALPDGHGGVGAERECRAATGVIHQRITAWSPGEELAFQMENTDLAFAPCVDGINELFTLEPTGCSSTRLVRTTTVTVRGALPAAKATVMYVGLKAVHRYVFASWRRQSRALASGDATRVC